MIRNQANQTIGAELINASTGAAFAGTVTVFVTIDAGVQALGTVGSGVCTAEGNGYFTYRPSQAETDGALIAFTFIGSGAVPATIQVATVTVAQAAQLTAGPAGVASGTVRAIGTDALIEIGVLEPGDTMSPQQGAIVLGRFQKQIDALAAQNLFGAVESRTVFTLPSGTSSVTIGPSGADITLTRPIRVDAVNFVIPGSSPIVEVPLGGPMTTAQYAGLSMKSLASALPTLWRYTTSTTSQLGSLFFWPQVTQNVDLVIYSPQAVGVPLALTDVMQGPPGYAEAFLYQLALRLVTPFGATMPDALPAMAGMALGNAKRANVEMSSVPNDLGFGRRHGYNILTDSSGGY